jgi:hypothetical protein
MLCINIKNYWQYFSNSNFKVKEDKEYKNNVTLRCAVPAT